MFLGQEQLHRTLQRTLLAASLRSGARARAEFQRCHLQQDVAALPSNLYQVRNTFIHIEAWLRDTTGMWHTFLSERAAECQRTNPCNGEEQGVADQRNIQSMPHGM